MFSHGRKTNYTDYIARLYSDPDHPVDESNKNFLPIASITFLITGDCCCRCSYCYLIKKDRTKTMTQEVAKRCIDRLFEMYDDPNDTFFNKEVNQGISLEFIGGEPLMNIDIMDYACTYFLDKCIKLHHPWLYTWRAHCISNGTHYFDPKFLNFLKKFHEFFSYNTSIDGPKEMHDACRIYPDGSGNFDDAWKALCHYRENYNNYTTTKVTIAPENLNHLNEIVNFFINNGVYCLFANPVFEPVWKDEDAKTYYDQLKLAADSLLKIPEDVDFYFDLFDNSFYRPMDPTMNQNWCGGDGRMIAFDPDGVAYPCMRFMECSLGDERKPIIIGNCYDGLYNTEETKEIKKELDSVTRRSQSTDECFNCSIAAGCSWCTAQNYQQTGSVNKRHTNLCLMHKAASLAVCYFWNSYYKKYNIDKKFHRYLSDEEALKIISQEELSMLDALEAE